VPAIRRVPPLVLAFLLAAAPSRARDLNGVTMADTGSAGTHALVLNGMGLRTKLMFKVYVGGLYLEAPSHDATAVIRSPQARRVEMHMLMALDGEKIAESIVEGFEHNSAAQMGLLRARLDRLTRMFPRLEKGQRIALTWIPERGTVVTVQGRELGVIEGKDFADALFAVWLGAVPADARLKAAMLGG